MAQTQDNPDPTKTPTSETVQPNPTTIDQRSTVPFFGPDGTPSIIAVDAEASLLIEYVASSSGNYTPFNNQRYLQALPNPIDDLMTDFGSRLYDVEMFKDPQVYSVMSVLVMGLLAQGARLVSPIEEQEADYAQAQIVLEFCKWTHDNIDRGVPEIMFELFEGMLKMGHKVGEKIYERKAWKGTKRTCLKAIKTKPHESTNFVGDAFNNVLGLIYARPGQPIPRLSIGADFANPTGTPVPVLPTDPNYSRNNMPRMIPREKFVIPTHRPRNGDPRGTSHMRSAYIPWWKKQQLNPQHLAYLVRFAQPSMYAKLPANARDLQIAKDGKTQKKGIVRATTDVLAAMKGGAVAALIDTDVVMLESRSRAEVIFASYDHEDRQIAKALLLQTMTTEESRSMARASSAVHQDVFGLLISFLRWILEKCWKEEVLKPLIRYNFGEDAAERFCPTVNLGDTQVHDIPALMAAISQLANAKGVHRSQWPKIWPILGLPLANMTQWQDEQDIIDKQVKQGQLPGASPAQGFPPGQQPSGGNPQSGPAKAPGRPGPSDRPGNPAPPKYSASGLGPQYEAGYEDGYEEALLYEIAGAR